MTQNNNVRKRQLAEISGVNNIGTQKVKQWFSNKFGSGPDSKMSAKDKFVKDGFIKDFIGRLYGDLDAAIKGNQVDPNIKNAQSGQPAAAAAPAQPTQAAAPTAAPAAATGQPAQQTPAQVRAAKQSAAASAAQAQMTNAPAAKAATTAPSKLSPQQVAAMKGKLKAGQGVGGKTSTGFKNYVAGSGERMTGVDSSGAPTFKKIQRESRYERLNTLFESILNEDAQSISQYLNNWVAQYLGNNINVSSLKPQLAAIEAAWGDNKKVQAAVTTLANAAYSVLRANPKANGQLAGEVNGAGAQAGSQASAPAASGSAGSNSGAAAPAGNTPVSPATNAALNKAPIDELPGLIFNALNRLKKEDPQSYNSLMAYFKGGGNTSKGAPVVKQATAQGKNTAQPASNTASPAASAPNPGPVPAASTAPSQPPKQPGRVEPTMAASQNSPANIAARKSALAQSKADPGGFNKAKAKFGSAFESRRR